MSDTPQVKVGDKLLIDHRLGSGFDIIEVTRIMPSGRIEAGTRILNPDLSIRGASKWGPFSARIPTAEDFENHKNKQNLGLISTTRFSGLSRESIQKIADIIRGKS